MDSDNEDIFTSDNLPRHDVPRQVMLLANALSRIHGPIVIRREAHGLHLYMASPAALDIDGRKELQSKHLTVNADRYFGIGYYLNKQGTYNRENSVICHKTGTKYTVDQLKQFPTLDKRGIKDVKREVYNNAFAREKFLVDDGKGHRIPLGPGLVMPLEDLDPAHPAVEYLLNRKYDLDVLKRQFRVGYCYSETPEQRDIGLYYRRLPGGFSDTPQGRIIFYIDIKGVQEGWQARILEKVEGNRRYFWHPYQNAWVLVHIKIGDVWQLRPDWQQGSYPWKPSKYRTGNGTTRSAVVMGFDAAVEWNTRMRIKEPFVVLVEGPLDAGRIGPPGISFLGKYLNADQGKLIARNFKKVIYIADNDKSGRESKNSIITSLAGKVELCEALVPDGSKDVGDMSTSDAWGLIKPFI